MNPPDQPKPAFHVRKRYIVLSVILGALLFSAVGVAGYFRLSSESRTLRQSVMAAVPGQWNKRFAIHVGMITTGLVRTGSRFVNLPPEPRAALDAVHCAEVGVYRLEDRVCIDSPSIFVAADKAMKARGWERIVGVTQPDQLVAVYIPVKGISPNRMACCLVVLHERDLVVVSARGNLKPLLELAEKRGLQRHLRFT